MNDWIIAGIGVSLLVVSGYDDTVSGWLWTIFGCTLTMMIYGDVESEN